MKNKKYIVGGIFLSFVLVILACITGNAKMRNFYASKLSQTDKSGLIHMAEEEKLAHDVYVFLYKKWKMPVFERIIGSETKHIQAVERLIGRFGLRNPMEGQKTGFFSLPNVQELYNKLIKEGSKSKIDALKVAATIEDLDIYDLENYIKHTSNPMIKRVYSNLMRGSRNHMRIFIRALKNLGGSYSPKYISRSLFEEIISTPLERGGRKPRYQTY